MGSTADLTTAIPWETQHVQNRRDEVRDAGDELCAIERQRANRRWQKLRQGCRLLALRVISHSRLEWSLLEQQRTSGGTGAEPIGSV